MLNHQYHPNFQLELLDYKSYWRKFQIDTVRSNRYVKKYGYHYLFIGNDWTIYITMTTIGFQYNP